MKKYILAVSAAATGAAAAGAHHKHAHLHERAVWTETDVVATATIFEINGTPISQAQACEGLIDGQYTMRDAGQQWGFCSSSSAAPTSTASSSTTTWAPSSSSNGGAFYQASSSWAAPAAASSSWSSWSGGSGVNTPFPNGQISCSEFPSQYGAVPLDYLGLGGWSGLQSLTFSGNAVSNIVTGVSGDTCQEGMACSYACPPGYQKSQWPSSQGATGQSVGGIMCQGGKLQLTNPSLSNQLCIQGNGGVQATNNAGKVVAICRTDYPGTESETIPVELQPGQTQPLTVPDAGSYYSWEGKSTSAQYYLNPPGYDASQACVWGNSGTPTGNFAPINFGVGYSNGKTWLSIFQNAPTTNAQYPGSVQLQGDLSGSCSYSNGQYCGATGCNSNGCTVSRHESLFSNNTNMYHRLLSTLAKLHLLSLAKWMLNIFSSTQG